MSGVDIEEPAVAPFPELKPYLARVALLMASDKTAAEIAADSNIALSTAYEYRSCVMRKLGVRGPAGVAAIAFRRGYLA